MPEYVRVTGLKELDRKLSRLPDKIQRDIMGKALEEGAEIIRAQAEANAPRDPSRTYGEHLADNIVLGEPERRGDETRILVGIDYTKVDHGHLVEFGHGGPHKAPKHPFMRPAFDSKSRAALGKIQTMLKALIEAAARRP